MQYVGLAYFFQKPPRIPTNPLGWLFSYGRLRYPLARVETRVVDNCRTRLELAMRPYFASLVCGLVLPVLSGCLLAQVGKKDDTPTKVEGDAAVTALTAGPKDPKEKEAPGKIDADAKTEFTTTQSGLKYRILRKSEGKKPGPKDVVTVHYKGWLDDGKIFDSSYQRAEKISFGLHQVIAGWTEGMQLVGEGGMIELEIPYQLGYGERGTPGGPIPGKATLHFVVELFKVGK